MSPTYPLLVDTSLNQPGAQIANVTIFGELTDVVLEPAGQPVVWTDLVDVTASGNTLTKPAGTPTAWTAGAVSTKAIVSGAGWTETTVLDLATYRVFGLSNGSSGQGAGDVDYGFYIQGSALAVMERGVLRTTSLTASQGDRLRVSVDGGVVKYWRDGVLVYTSLVPATYPLLVDTSLNQPVRRSQRSRSLAR